MKKAKRHLPPARSVEEARELVARLTQHRLENGEPLSRGEERRINRALRLRGKGYTKKGRKRTGRKNRRNKTQRNER